MMLKIEEMTLEQKLGMLFCARRFTVEEDIEFTLELIRKRALGCVQLTAGKHEVNKRILDAADYPLLIFNDTESGFPTSPMPHTPLMSLAACGDAESYKAFARGIAHYAKENGFNGTWGPVLDVLRGDGPCRVHRHFSDDPKVVAESAELIAEIYRANGYLSTGKHYPGAHSCPYDTHMTEGDSDVPVSDIVDFDLYPYLYLHKKGLLPCIMTDHTVYSNVDPDYPASLSKKVIDLIRDRGFDGVCFTDSFAMMGVLQKYGEENIYGMSIAAGNDIFLPNYRTPTKQCYDMYIKNYNDGAFTEERLNESVRRVLKAMEFVAAKPENPTVYTEQDVVTINNIARDCITAVTDDGVSAALDTSNKDRMFVIVTDNSYDPNQDVQEITVANWYNPTNIANKIKENFPEAEIAYLPEFPNAGQNGVVLNAAVAHKEVVFVTFCNTTAYLGTDSLTKRVEMVINCLVNSGKVSAVVHFGNPYAVKPLLHVPRVIFGYQMPDSQKFAIDVLAGKLEAKGKLPYNIGL